MRGEYEELSCPFCDKGRIQCLHIPSSRSVKIKSTATFGRQRTYRKNPDIWIIKSGCNSCGKTSEEVEKKLKNEGII